MTGGVDKVSLLCMNLLGGGMQDPSSVLGSFLIEGSFESNETGPLPIVYHIKAKQRAWSEKDRQHRETEWYSLGQVRRKTQKVNLSKLKTCI